MTTDWQQAVAIAVVAITAAYLGWRVWKRLAGKNTTGCGTCSGCTAREPTESDAEGFRCRVSVFSNSK